VPGIFIQASEEITLAILPHSLTLGSAPLPNQCLAFSFRQVNKTSAILPLYLTLGSAPLPNQSLAFHSGKWKNNISNIATLSDSGVSTIAKSVPGIFIQASEENIISNIATLSDTGVSTIAKSVPGIFIQASEEIILEILPLSLTLGSAPLPNQCLAFSLRQVKK
jgi:hypothetical protein